MAGSDKLHKAKNAKFDEFYTQYSDIQAEVNAYIEYNPEVFKDKTILLPCDDPEWSNFTKLFAQNFERFGLKKLISTSYAYDSKNYKEPYQLSLFESTSPKFDKKKTKSHGKIFVLEKDKNKSGKIDINDLEWDYLEGDGDFRSEEVKKLRDEADIIITNPPFSLYREFVNWLMEADKKFLIIGNKLSPSNKEILSNGYKKYDNYDAIEIPYTDAIPSDYEGIMGVPVSFLEKYNPEQFVILGSTQRGCHDKVPDTKKYNDYIEIKPNGKPTGSSGNKTNENANLEQNDGKHNYFQNKEGHIIQSAPSRIFIKFKK